MVGWAVIPSGRATGGGDDSSPGCGCGSWLMELRGALLKADAALQGRRSTPRQNAPTSCGAGGTGRQRDRGQ